METSMLVLNVNEQFIILGKYFQSVRVWEQNIQMCEIVKNYWLEYYKKTQRVGHNK